MSEPPIKDTVRQKYGQEALRVLSGKGSACCSSDLSSHLYSAEQAAGLPETAVLASLGCGNPTALATLHPGETVLDLGSGGGIDVLLSARRVGPTGKVYGLDMTDEMLALARENQRQGGVPNMELWVGCVAGALEEGEFRALLAENGFVEISIEPTRVYEFTDAQALLGRAGLDADVLAREVSGRVMGAFVRARKPARR